MNLRIPIKKFWQQYRNYAQEKKHIYLLKKRLDKAQRTQILDGKTVIFNTVKNVIGIIDREAFLAKILALNGAKVIILLDDGLLNHWDTLTYDSQKKLKIEKRFLNPGLYSTIPQKIRNFLLNRKIILHKKLFQDPNLTYKKYGELLEEADCLTQNRSLFKKSARESTIRFFKNSNIDFSQDPFKKYYLLSYQNCQITYSVAQKANEIYKPDIFISSHGIYSLWEPMYEYFTDQGIRSFIYAGNHGHALNRKFFYLADSRIQTLTRSQMWQKFKQKKLSTDMKEKVDNYFDLRFSHRTNDTKEYFGQSSKNFEIIQNPKIKYHVAVFPGSIWDGNIKNRHIAFSGIVNWLEETINYFKKRPEIMVYVKFHPAEITFFKSSFGLADILREKIPDLDTYKNIMLIEPKEHVETYTFLKSGVDLGIIYDGFLGLELPFLKIPVLMGAVEGLFTISDGNFTIHSNTDYFNYLDNIEGLIQNFNENYPRYMQNIYKFCYWYLFENPFELATIPVDKSKESDIMNLRVEDFRIPKKLLDIINND